MIANPTDVANRTRRRVALRLLPYLALLYIIAFLDRSNISTAALQMPRDLGFDDRVLGLGSGIFFAGYFLLEIPGAMIVEKWGARRWIARIMVTWGVVSVGMAFIRNEREFYTLRFLLGLAEAGFFPGVLVYLTHWFIHSDRSKSVAAFMSAIPLSFVIGSPISGWLLGVNWHSLRGWRWLFILEGLPAILFGIITWFYLTDWPRDAAWLPADEREWLDARLADEAAARRVVRTYTVWQAFRDPRVLLSPACCDCLQLHILASHDSETPDKFDGLSRDARRLAHLFG
jgi:ACS family tartrate transporter-like MFS transporter